jgi:crotonobetainyl-CoA:carnitine CoA-transferase CaiB-like acyl-CoA transferase
MSLPEHLPLRRLRVLDLTDGPAGKATRFLADMGADVILVEPPAGAASRCTQPRCGATSLEFITTHWNKRAITIDVEDPDGRDHLLRLVDTADIVVESFRPGYLAGVGLDPAALRERKRSLVVVSITDFGQNGPYRDWRASEAVLLAMSSSLTRSGAPGRSPLSPPGRFATETAAVHAAYVALLAYFRARRTGQGDYIDCSLFDMSVQCLDPGYGMGGSATMGVPISELPLGRPDVRMRYPIIACSDGHVRLCMLAPKHWRAMFEWLGRPDEFADPAYDKLALRFSSWDRLTPLIEQLFATQTRNALLDEGTRRGIPIASLGSPQEILASDHVAARQSFIRVEVNPGVVGTVPNGYVEFNGKRAGFRHGAPTDPRRAVDWVDATTVAAMGARAAVHRPLDGLRVLDLGVIVVGGETGRMLADQGADVIKVENRAFADGARQGDHRDVVNYAFAVGNRGKRSLGLNLRTTEGKELFGRLVGQCDVVLSNFKPGTMESLGLDYEALRRLNPAVIVVESSALGNTGPCSRRMGYGPLVRATVGLTALWRHADSKDGFGDDMTVYPDHAAARVAVAAIMAALVARESGGQGCHIGIAQMETVFMQLAAEYLRESLTPGSLIPRDGVNEFDAPSGVFACQGEDAYCVVDVDGDDDWRRLANAIGEPDLVASAEYATAAGRVAHREVLDAALTAWTSSLTPQEAAQRLQAAGIAAGAARHVRELADDPHLRARNQFAELPQPGLPPPVTTESGPAVFDSIPAPVMRRAPLMGEHTREICRELLGLSDSEVDDLIAADALEEYQRTREPA